MERVAPVRIEAVKALVDRFEDRLDLTRLQTQRLMRAHPRF